MGFAHELDFWTVW